MNIQGAVNETISSVAHTARTMKRAGIISSLPYHPSLSELRHSYLTKGLLSYQQNLEADRKQADMLARRIAEARGRSEDNG